MDSAAMDNGVTTTTPLPRTSQQDDNILNTTATTTAPANATLPVNAKSRKQSLKRWLRLCGRARKMEWRYRKTVEAADDGDDDSTAAAARQAWQDALAAVDEAAATLGGEGEQQQDVVLPRQDPGPMVQEQLMYARKQIEGTYHALQRALPSADSDHHAFD